MAILITEISNTLPNAHVLFSKRAGASICMSSGSLLAWSSPLSVSNSVLILVLFVRFLCLVDLFLFGEGGYDC